MFADDENAPRVQGFIYCMCDMEKVMSKSVCRGRYVWRRWRLADRRGGRCQMKREAGSCADRYSNDGSSIATARRLVLTLF